jgi:hypothetical protein
VREEVARVIEWRCFQCDEVFTDEACAKLHFGEYQDCTPICKVGAERYRDLENQLASYRSESDAASKAFYALGAEHSQALIREEQRGYDKGLRDARHEEIWRWLAVPADPLRAAINTAIAKGLYPQITYTRPADQHFSPPDPERAWTAEVYGREGTWTGEGPTAEGALREAMGGKS